jgi:hypothetical protein
MGIGGMTVGWFIFVLTGLGVLGIGFIWLVVALDRIRATQNETHDARKAFVDMAEDDIDHFFNTEFREELRNRGRMQEAQELTEASLKRTAEDVNARHAALTQSLEKEVAERKAVLIQQFEAGMAEVVEHYVLQALSDSLDLKAQMPYIVKQMESIKPDMIKDMQL